MTIQKNPFNFYRFVNFADYFLLALSVSITLFIRLRYLNLPLERDEGEYAYAGMQLHNGFAAYENVYNMKFPGAYIFYAFIFNFGHSLSFIRICFLIVYCAHLLLLFSIVKNLFHNSKPAVYTIIIYALLTSSFSSYGLLGKAEPVAVLFFLAALQIICRKSITQKKNILSIILSGILMGACVLVKQNCLLFAPVIIFYILFFFEKKIRPLLMFTTGFAIPLLLVLIHLLIAGTLNEFKFLTIDYASQYGGIVSINNGLHIFQYELNKLFDYNQIAFIICAAGILFVAFLSFTQKNYRLLLLWLISAMIAFSAGFYFRPHYFLLVYPAFAICGGLLLYRLGSFFKIPVFQFLPGLLISVMYFFFICSQINFIFKDDAATTMHKMYIWTPFPECVQIGNDIRQMTTENATIGMIGSEPEIAFYAGRQLASGYLYLYPFFENQKYALEMTTQFISETEKKQPEIMIWSNVSWDATNNKSCEKIIEDWWENFKQQYQLVESVCSDSDYGVRFFETEEPKAYYNHWVACIQVYKKINPASEKPADQISHTQ